MVSRRHDNRRKWSTHPVPLLHVCIRLGPEFLDAQEQADPIADLLDAHLLENLLIHLEQVLTVYVVFPEELLVLSALNTAQVFADLVLVPVLGGTGAIDVRELGLGRAGEALAGGDQGRGSSRRRHVRGGCVGNERRTR
jgi:hypothetical protein